MRISGGAEQQPTSAERVRAILTSAHSMTMVADGRSTEVSRGSGPGATQHVHLHPSPRMPVSPARPGRASGCSPP